MSAHIKICLLGIQGLDDPDILQNRRIKRIVDTPFGKPSNDLIIGEISGVTCILFDRNGRKGGINPTNINYRANIWAFKEEGCTHIISTSICTSLKDNIKPGEIIVLDSYINLTTCRKLTFYDGQSGHPRGICRITMDPAFNEELRDIAISTLKEFGIKAHQTGIMVSIEGPRLSSLAEANMYRAWGADVINMVVVPEVMLARELGICYVCLGYVCEYDVTETRNICLTQILSIMKENANKFSQVIHAMIPKIQNTNWKASFQRLQQAVKQSIVLISEN